jgi:hypothetical protein
MQKARAGVERVLRSEATRTIERSTYLEASPETIWDHWIEIAPESSGTRYLDRIHLDAGLLTPLIAAFAAIFYNYRQKRWRKLVRSNFAY